MSASPPTAAQNRTSPDFAFGPRADSRAATRTSVWPLPPARRIDVALQELPAGHAEIPSIAMGSTGATGRRLAYHPHDMGSLYDKVPRELPRGRRRQADTAREVPSALAARRECDAVCEGCCRIPITAATRAERSQHSDTYRGGSSLHRSRNAILTIRSRYQTTSVEYAAGVS